MINSFSTPQTLSDELGVDPKRIRKWLRAQGWRSEVEKGQSWELSPEQTEAVHIQFGPIQNAGPESFNAKDWNVGELLQAYSSILGELRSRGLVRTNNAPVGDLAEYACAIVYGGVLAPNSAKSYDLTAADGRRIQVKVRNIREDTRSSSVFSPLRSFDFDVCVFVLVDERQGVVSAAYEWTADDVQAHGTHRTHTNGTVIRLRQVRSAGIGLNVTDSVRAAWSAMLALTSVVPDQAQH